MASHHAIHHSTHHSTPHSTRTRIPLTHNPRYKFNGTGSYLYALRKYGIQPPSYGSVFINRQNRLAVRDPESDAEIGEVPTENFQNDSFYLCPVTIGTGSSAVTLNLDFDTGSSDLWVFSSLLPKSVSTTGHNIYNPKNSSTAKVVSGAKWSISYGDGSSASGVVYTDTVTVGGISIKNQAVECATKLSSSFSSGSGDGLLGLAFGSINTVTPGPVATPVMNMGTEGVITPGEEVFTCELTRHDEAPGFYTFGFIDQALLGSQSPFYTSVDSSNGFWQLASTSAVVAGQVIQRAGNTAIADTGTTLCLVDKSLCEAIYAQIPGSKYDSASEGYIFPISNTASTLPVVELGIGDPESEAGEQRFSILPRDLAFAQANPGWVYGGFQDRGSMDFDIFGDVFLKNVYAIWDVQNTRWGAVPRTAGPFVTSQSTFLNQGVETNGS